MKQLAVTLLIPTLAAPLLAQITLPVRATMDLYRAGGYNDNSDGIAPAVYSFPAHAHQTLTFSSVSGSWACHTNVTEWTPDGTSALPCYVGPQSISAVGTFAGYNLTDFAGAMAGIFLEDTLPTSAPPALRFYANDASQGGTQTNFTSLSPNIGQVFFIGDGLTGTGIGTTQQFRVPPTATHLYLGYVSNCPGASMPGCYAHNVSSLTAIFQLQQYALNWVERTLSSYPSARYAMGMAYDAAGSSIVLFGGATFGSVEGDTWIWHNGWTQASPTASPSARLSPATAYDPTTGTVVLFGGQPSNGDSSFDDTWTWDGVTWTQQFPPVSPPANSFDSQSMVYDAATGTIVLFDGLSGDVGETWEWNGRMKTWKQDFPASSPPPQNTVLAYDSRTREVVLFGGNQGGTCPNNTWTWNGITWTQRFPASSPSGRCASAFIYDPYLGRVVLFGGTASDVQFNDTWLWNGITWTQLRTDNQPSGRFAAGIAVDPLNGGLLLFGGDALSAVLDDTWLLVPVPVN